MELAGRKIYRVTLSGEEREALHEIQRDKTVETEPVSVPTGASIPPTLAPATSNSTRQYNEGEVLLSISK